jgi:hypothetical protein
LAILDTSQASKHKLESLYLAKVTSHDRLLFANLDWSIPDTLSLLSIPLERYLSVLANSCGTGTLQDLHLHTISPLILAFFTAATKEDNSNWWQAMNGPYAKESGRLPRLRLRHWRGFKPGQLCLAPTTSPTFYHPLGPSRSNATQMDLSKISRAASVLKATSRSKE